MKNLEVVQAVNSFFGKKKIKCRKGVLNASPIWIVQL